MSNGQQQSRSDFQTNLLLREKTNKHDKDITDIKKRLNAIELRVADNEKFANSFADCLGTQTIASNALVDRINNAVATNAVTREELGKFVKQHDKHELSTNVRKFGTAVFWLIMGTLISSVGGWVMTRMIPKEDAQIESLQEQIDQLKNP